MMGDETNPAGERAFGPNPFSALDLAGLPPGPPEVRTVPTTGASAARKSRGRVDIQRQKAGRGGKTVTVVSGFVGIGLPEKQQLAQRLQKACGTGGTVKEGRIEIQGDQREAVARLLTEAGFRPVFTGG
jgi:translation initiation factor 1